MSRAGGHLLRQDGSNKLAFAIEVEYPLDADENVIRRAKSHRRAPRNAAAFVLDNAPHCV